MTSAADRLAELVADVYPTVSIDPTRRCTRCGIAGVVAHLGICADCAEVTTDLRETALGPNRSPPNHPRAPRRGRHTCRPRYQPRPKGEPMALFNRNTPPAPELISAQRSDYGLAILLALNASGRHIYEGTVPAAERDRTRARNKAARRARATHRKARR